MSDLLIPMLTATGFVVLAEMGDKTQLLAMAFATKYKPSKVLLGVFIATVFNHALAVTLGYFAANISAISLWIQVIASLSFVFFGLWTIRGDKLEGQDKKPTKFGAVMTVTIAFFIAEMGDKTQLATISLATQFPKSPVAVLIGTTTGMLIADIIGIFVGVLIYKLVAERMIKLISAGAFMLFGYIGTFQVLTEKLNISFAFALIITVAIIAISLFIGYKIISKENSIKKTNK